MLAPMFGLFDLMPPTAWVVVCLALAALYLRAWPRRRAVGLTKGFRYLVLRWFHPLVWLLLAISVAVRAQSGRTPYVVASAIAILALLVYVVFLFVAFTKGPSPAASSDDTGSA
jgi:FtsH-binding integral membrane protein